MTREPDQLRAALREAVPPARPPAGLADRAFRAAMGADSALFADRFVVAARRAALVGAIATALVWGGLLLRGRAGDTTATASAQLDPAEAALSLWVGGEESSGGD